MTPAQRIFLFIVGFGVGMVIILLTGCKTASKKPEGCIDYCPMDRWEKTR